MLGEAYANVQDALAAVVELYSETGRTLPVSMDSAVTNTSPSSA